MTAAGGRRSVALAALLAAVLPGAPGHAADAFAPRPLDAGFDYQMRAPHP